MKKILLLLGLLCGVLVFAACTTLTNSSTTSTISGSTSTSTIEPNVVLDPDTGLPDYAQMKRKGSAELTFKELGIAMHTFEITSSPEVAQMLVINANSKHYFTLYNPGTMKVSGADCYGREAEFNLIVNEDFSSRIEITKRPTSELPYEVHQFRFDDSGAPRNDHAMIQAAIDAAHTAYTSTKVKQTVYVYPGLYTVQHLVIKEGVILDMYTTMDKATDGFTDKLADDIANQRCAILRAANNSSGARNARIMNAPFQTDGTKGYSNFTIRGGVLDMNGKSVSFLILGCANNVTIENVIFKDVYNNHAVQLTACTNTTMSNCMFAGFKLGTDFAREVVQIEHASANATGDSSKDTPPLVFNDNIKRFAKNVTIDQCYFGKSDEYDAPWIAIGHHSGSAKQANVTTLNITNNVFDECIYAAIRYNGVEGMSITGNTFIATSASNYSNFSSSITGLPTIINVPAMIIFYHRNDTDYTKDYGMQNAKIENNTFDFGAGVDRRIIYYESSTDCNETISVQNNTINFAGTLTYSDYHVRLTGITNLTYKNNKVNKPSSVTFNPGVYK